MAMNDLILGVTLKEHFPCLHILEDIESRKAWDPVYSASKPRDFILEKTVLSGVDNKIKLDLRTVNVSIQIHNHDFCTTNLQASQYLKYSHNLFHY